MKAVVIVTLKPEVLDPEGRAIQRACHALGHTGVRDVRQGKRFEINLDVADRGASERLLRELAEKLLSNPVIEDFQIERLEAEEGKP